ncbi:BTB/POZ protein [Penicillium vulpinum]|uniref:BTB/POZ protein n=1 Tax=Penicillium vulpinum TaxID=29845 RepID=UPI002548EBE1|nr:BTB/POZ protein [Penicillium vulpinum]KAJ5964554.1 BTB/POZ protein [Penicillium vulpinum]
MSMPSDFQDVMRNLLLQGQFSDMEIICQGITFKPHRAIVCTQSSYFNSAICGGFKETIAKAINLPEDNPGTIVSCPSFTFGKLATPNPEDKMKDTEDKKIALNNMEVFISADKFGIIPLKSLATQNFSRWATANWNSPVFPGVVREVMTSVPSHELSRRESIVEVLSAHIFDLIESPEMLDVLNSFGCLGSLIIAALVRKGQVNHPNEHDIFRGLVRNLNSRHKCRHCATSFNVRIEGGEYLKGVFRCASCNSRH